MACRLRKRAFGRNCVRRLDAVVEAAGARALAAHGLKVVDAAPVRRPVKAARRVSRGVGFRRPAIPTT
jgi:hypothetical protein